MHSCCMIVSEKLVVNLDEGLVELHAGAETRCFESDFGLVRCEYTLV